MTDTQQPLDTEASLAACRDLLEAETVKRLQLETELTALRRHAVIMRDTNTDLVEHLADSRRRHLDAGSSTTPTRQDGQSRWHSSHVTLLGRRRWEIAVTHSDTQGGLGLYHRAWHDDGEPQEVTIPGASRIRRDVIGEQASWTARVGHRSATLWVQRARISDT